jgi:hypothetical protein
MRDVGRSVLFADREDWRQLVGARNDGGIWDLQDALIDRLLSEDVSELVSLCSCAGEASRFAAVGVLMELARRGDARLSEVLRREWLVCLVGAVRKEFPNSLLSIRSYQAWRDQDKVAAETFIAEELPLQRIKDERGAIHVVLQLRSFAAVGSERALRRLRSMDGLAGRAAEEQTRALQALRPVEPDEVQLLAKEWRGTQSAPALRKIYDRYIGGLPVGRVLIEDLVKLLGPPTQRRGNDVWYQPDSDNQLFLEGDANGYLRGRRCS